MDVSYPCHVSPNLLSTVSLFPGGEGGNWFKIKGERAVLSPDAEKSMVLRWGSPDV
jgi:hypothetical protein